MRGLKTKAKALIRKAANAVHIPRGRQPQAAVARVATPPPAPVATKTATVTEVSVAPKALVRPSPAFEHGPRRRAPVDLDLLEEKMPELELFKPVKISPIIEGRVPDWVFENYPEVESQAELDHMLGELAIALHELEQVEIAFEADAEPEAEVEASLDKKIEDKADVVVDDKVKVDTVDTKVKVDIVDTCGAAEAAADKITVGKGAVELNGDKLVTPVAFPEGEAAKTPTAAAAATGVAPTPEAAAPAMRRGLVAAVMASVATTRVQDATTTAPSAVSAEKLDLQEVENTNLQSAPGAAAPSATRGAKTLSAELADLLAETGEQTLAPAPRPAAFPPLPAPPPPFGDLGLPAPVAFFPAPSVASTLALAGTAVAGGAKASRWAVARATRPALIVDAGATAAAPPAAAVPPAAALPALALPGSEAAPGSVESPGGSLLGPSPTPPALLDAPSLAPPAPARSPTHQADAKPGVILGAVAEAANIDGASPRKGAVEPAALRDQHEEVACEDAASETKAALQAQIAGLKAELAEVARLAGTLIAENSGLRQELKEARAEANDLREELEEEEEMSRLLQKARADAEAVAVKIEKETSDTIKTLEAKHEKALRGIKAEMSAQTAARDLERRKLLDDLERAEDAQIHSERALIGQSRAAIAERNGAIAQRDAAIAALNTELDAVRACMSAALEDSVASEARVEQLEALLAAAAQAGPTPRTTPGPTPSPETTATEATTTLPPTPEVTEATAEEEKKEVGGVELGREEKDGEKVEEGGEKEKEVVESVAGLRALVLPQRMRERVKSGEVRPRRASAFI